MVTAESISIPALREMAAEMRRKANEIDAHIDALLAVAGVLDKPLAPKPARNVPPRSTAAPAMSRDADEKSSRYGIITRKWIDVLKVLAAAVGGDSFSIDLAVDAVKEAQGKSRRPTEVKRQFEPYIDAGYLTLHDDGSYSFTDRGFLKIGFSTDEPLEATKENGPPDDFDAMLSEPDAEKEDAPTSPFHGIKL